MDKQQAFQIIRSMLDEKILTAREIKNYLKTIKHTQKRTQIEKFRDKLVKRQTPAEIKFAMLLKDLNIKFKKQHIIQSISPNAIADFYIPEYNLVIEIDGEYHNTWEQQRADNIRTGKLISVGYKVKRFTNKQVFYELETTIKQYLYNLNNT